jgi:hypothetical protein
MIFEKNEGSKPWKRKNGLILKDIFKILYYNEEFDPGSG